MTVNLTGVLPRDGEAGEVLTSQGPNTVPIWDAAASDPYVPPVASDPQFAPEPTSEVVVEAEGGLLLDAANIGGPGDATDWTRAELTVVSGDTFSRSQDHLGAAGHGQTRYPVAGVLDWATPHIEFDVISVGADFTAQADNEQVLLISTINTSADQYLLAYKVGGNKLRVTFSFVSRITGISNVNNQVDVTIGVGDIPADTKKRIVFDYNGTSLTTYVGGVLKSTTAIASSAWAWRWDMDGDPRLPHQGLTLGGGNGIQAADSPFRIGNVSFAALDRPVVSVDAATLGAAWTKRLTGTVTHRTTDTGIFTQQLARAVAAGHDFVRITEFDLTAVPTLDGSGNVTSINFTAFDAQWDPWINAGYDVHMWLGYTPAAMATGGDRFNVPTSIPKATMYYSLVLDHCEERWGSDRIKSLSFYNEPSIFFNGTTSGTSSNIADMWAAAAAMVRDDHPALPSLGGADELWEVAGSGAAQTVQKAIIDRAVLDSLPLEYLYLHQYDGNLGLLRHNIRALKAYAVSVGLNPTVRVSEWNYSLSYHSQIPNNVTQNYQDNRAGKIHVGAFAHAGICTMLDEGVDLATYFTFSFPDWAGPGAAEWVMGMQDGEDPPRAHPSFNVFELLWKHEGSLIGCTVDPDIRVRAIATKASDGRIMLTASSYRPWKWDEQTEIAFTFENLPSRFNWTMWRVDATTGTPAGDGLGSVVEALEVVSTGTRADLPHTVSVTGLGVIGLEIEPY